MSHAAAAWPDAAASRDAFVLARRPERPPADPWSAPPLLVEDERGADGTVVRSATIFLAGRECPWRCAMCDLWMHTTDRDTPPGALPAQLRHARAALGTVLPAQVKLYNAGSFFDPRAVPLADYGALAQGVSGVRHVIVESHPRLVGPRLLRWREALAAASDAPPSLEVAIGLETAHPGALEGLHKRFTLDDFARAADRVLAAGAALRVFLLVGVPFVARDQQLDWVRRSARYAFACGASVVSLIPTRSGNGTLEALAAAGLFDPPDLADLERAIDACLPDAAGRLFADLWELQRFSRCAACLDARRARLHAMNLQQAPLAPVACAACAVSRPAS